MVEDGWTGGTEGPPLRGLNIRPESLAAKCLTDRGPKASIAYDREFIDQLSGRAWLKTDGLVVLKDRRCAG